MRTIVDVQTISIDSQVISFECPFCWTKYKKNGQPYANAKPKIHTTGSTGNLENRVEHKGDSCHSGRFPVNHSGFNVHINDATVRK